MEYFTSEKFTVTNIKNNIKKKLMGEELIQNKLGARIDKF